MAKKSMIARDVKRKKMAERYAAKRAALMAASAPHPPQQSRKSAVTVHTAAPVLRSTAFWR